MKLPAIVLAGGASTRMGAPKALLRVGEDTFLSRILGTLVAAGGDDVVIVTGGDDAPIRASVDRWAQAPPALSAACDLTVRVVRNDAPDADQFSSLRRALAAVEHPGLEGVLVTLVDHPFVSLATVRALLDRFSVSRAPVVRPRCAGRHGHPIIFGREAFALVLGARAHDGAKAVVRAFADRQQIVEVDDEGIWTDVDTPKEYDVALRRFGRNPLAR